MDDSLEKQLPQEAMQAFSIVRSLLGDTIVGAYLIGSAVVGGLRLDSDVDVLVVVRERLSEKSRRDLVAASAQERDCSKERECENLRCGDDKYWPMNRESMMSDAISLRFESELHASAERVWEWITSLDGISAELRPLLRMTAPRDIRSLGDIQFQPGVRLFRSYVFLLGVLPMDYSDLTLLELDAGRGFVEQSPMGSMKLWRHERRIEPSASDPSAVLLVDQLTFRPRMAKRLVGWFIRRVFSHRHNVLKARFGGGQQGTRVGAG